MGAFREHLREPGGAGASIGVLAKIESADSVGNLEDILDAVDGAMVARGDLGAELPVEEVQPNWNLISQKYVSNTSVWVVEFETRI